MDIVEYLEKVCDYLEKSDTQTHEKMMIVAEVAAVSNLSIKETHALIKRVTDKSISDYINSESYNDEFKWSSAMGVDGLIQIFEQGATPKEAFEFVMNKYDKTPEWVDKVKNKRIRNSGLIVQETEKTSKKVVKLKKQKVYDKKSLAVASTPNSQFNKAHKIITISDRLDNMEQRMLEYEQRVERQQLALMAMEERLNCAEQNISNVTQDVNTITTAHLKSLQDSGKTLSEISTILGIPLRRVKYLLYQK